MPSELIDSVGSLVETLQKLQLLSSSQMAEVAKHLGRRTEEPKGLARDLIQRGWLTPFQVEQLLRGLGAQLALGQYVLLELLGDETLRSIARWKPFVPEFRKPRWREPWNTPPERRVRKACRFLRSLLPENVPRCPTAGRQRQPFQSRDSWSATSVLYSPIIVPI